MADPVTTGFYTLYAIEAALTAGYIWVLGCLSYSNVPIHTSSFFILFVSTGWCGVLNELVLIVMRLVSEIMMEAYNHDLAMRICFCVAHGASVAHTIGSLLSILNRVSATQTTNYHKIWSRRRLVAMIGAQWLVPAAVFAVFLSCGASYLWMPDGKHSILTGLLGTPMLITKGIMCVTYGVFAVVSVPLNIFAWVALRKRIKNAVRLSKTMKHDAIMLWQTSATCAAHVVGLATQVVWTAGIFVGDAQLEIAALRGFALASCTIVFIPPVMLLALSPPTRRAATRPFRRVAAPFVKCLPLLPKASSNNVTITNGAVSSLNHHSMQY